MFDKKPSPSSDPVFKLIEDLSRAGASLARAVKAAREGVRGVTYEEWFIRKKIDEELAGVGMQVITKLK